MIVREEVVNGSGLEFWSRLLGTDLIEFMFHVFENGKEGCEEQEMPSLAKFQR